MKPKSKRSIFITLALFAPLLTAAEELPAKLHQCSQISADAQRLACYDQLAVGIDRLQKESAQPTQPAAVASTQQATAAATQAAAVSPSPTSKKSASIATPARNDAVASFGLKKKEDDVEHIESRIVGEFKGWKKGAILELANGQRWEVTGRNRGYVRLKNPRIVIKKGAFGSFNAKVDGLNAASKVKRID